MVSKDIEEPIKARRYYLKKIIANKIEKRPDTKEIKIAQEIKHSILNNNNEHLTININIKTFLEPEALFSIELEYIIEFKLNNALRNDEVKKNINKLISPLGQEVSYTISSITKEMLGTPIVLPPKLKITTD